jgi:hypothetical protein
MTPKYRQTRRVRRKVYHMIDAALEAAARRAAAEDAAEQWLHKHESENIALAQEFYASMDDAALAISAAHIKLCWRELRREARRRGLID